MWGLERTIACIYTRCGISVEVTFLGLVHGVLLLCRATTGHGGNVQSIDFGTFNRSSVTRGTLFNILTGNANIGGGGVNIFRVIGGFVATERGRALWTFTITCILLATRNGGTNF